MQARGRSPNSIRGARFRTTEVESPLQVSLRSNFETSSNTLAVHWSARAMALMIEVMEAGTRPLAVHLIGSLNYC